MSLPIGIRIFHRRRPLVIQSTIRRTLSKIPVKLPKKSYELVIVGGGSGGLAIAARFARYFRVLKKSPDSIAVIEPKDVHYYQPLWTLVGAGIKDLQSSGKPMSSVMPPEVDWIKEYCNSIDPDRCRITLAGAGGTVEYQYLVMAAGIQIDWDKIPGLFEALQDPQSGVCSNYSDQTVMRTWENLRKFQGGEAVFTFPNTPIKCAGAPQKIMYLSDAHLRQKGIRGKSNLTYFTSLPALFGVKHYSNALAELCKRRNLNYNLRTNLIRVDPARKMAVFQNLDRPEEPAIEKNYDMLHVAPPMSAAPLLRPLASDTSNGFVAVDPKTLQHVRYPNIFALGDCSSLPTSKTAAAIASQNYVLAGNLLEVIRKDGKKVSDFPYSYDGYTSCPIVTGDQRCIMAEFNYQLEPLETFPLDQSKERRTMYYVKRDILPFIYWNAMLKGYWSGPGPYRKLIHFGFK